MPADYIIVKGALALGRRPKDFYLQIADLKNVVLVDPADTGLDYVNNAVACITGTAAVGVRAVLGNQ